MTGDVIADPERALSVGYAPAAARAGLTALWMLDERLGGIIASTSNPAIGQIRLTWWHDALTGNAPLDEPLLRSISGLNIDAARWPPLLDAWEVLLEPLPLGEMQLLAHARGRGATLFAVAAALSGAASTSAIEEAGARWALVDLGFRISDRATAQAALTLARTLTPPTSWPAPLRSLGMLSVLAARDLAAGAGTQRRPGSPARVMRALLHRITGR